MTRAKANILSRINAVIGSREPGVGSRRSRHLLSVICYLLSVICAAGLTGNALAASSIASIVGPGNETYAAGGEIYFTVSLGDEVTADPIGGTPYLVLSGIQPATPARHALYSGLVPGDNGNALEFTYTVRPGDFSAGLGIASLELDGATVPTAAGDFTDADTALPAGAVLNGETIAIQTITFAETGTQAMTLSAVKGAKIDVVISLGGAATTDQRFTVTRPTDKVTAPNTLTIPAGNSAATNTITLKEVTDGPIDITYHPRAYAGTAGDLTLSISINDPIVAVRPVTPNGTYNAGDIQVEVVLGGQITDVGAGTPTLKLPMSPNQRTATLVGDISSYVGASSLLFGYTIQAGDFASDLDCSFGTFPGGLKIDGVALTTADWNAMPTGGAAGSLSSNANINVETVFIKGSSTPRAMSLNGKVDDPPLKVTIARSGANATVGDLTFTFPSPATGYVTYGDFSIPAGQTEATFTITPIASTTALAEPLKLSLRPQGYPEDGSGDITLSPITIEPSAIARAINIIGTDTVLETNAEFSVTVQLSRPPTETITVTVSNSIPASLRIKSWRKSNGLTGGANADGTATIQFEKDSTATYQIFLEPRDGLAEGSDVVTISATADKTYEPRYHDITVKNQPPRAIVEPLSDEGEWVLTGWGARTENIINWTATDASGIDLKAGITAIVDFGDGTPTNVVMCTSAGAGSVRHTYIVARGDPENRTGGYGISITLIDKDGGEYILHGRVIVDPPATATIREYKRNERLSNGYLSGRLYYSSAAHGGIMQGMGEGSVVDTLDSERENINPNYTWHSFYNRGQGAVEFKCVPNDFEDKDPHAADPDADPVTFNSFVHVWQGPDFTTEDVLDPAFHLDTATVIIDLDTASVTVGGVFARERYPEDGCADIDNDELPDIWEDMVFPGVYAFEHQGGSPETPWGRDDNPDMDFLPRCVESVDPVTGAFVLTKDKERALNFTPDGLPFINVYEVRGTHWGLNMDPEETSVQSLTNITWRTIVETVFDEGADPAVDAPQSAVTNRIDVALVESEFPNLAAAGLCSNLLEAAENASVSVTTNNTDIYWSWNSETNETVTVRYAIPVEPQDEPHYGAYDENTHAFTDAGTGNTRHPFYGTHPNMADTDGDRLTDGYEYFFWRNAKFATQTIGYAYSPALVIEGVAIDNALIEATFNPCVPNDALSVDTDNDGLSNFEEMLIGTNPIHWDTDGDSMNDGWEVMWGLNPFADDHNANPDGDYMACDGTYRHFEIYREYGFDPRTAINATYLERNRVKSLPAPNTAPFTNYEEYSLARFLIDNNMAVSAPPMSIHLMTQPVPYGQMHHLVIENKDEPPKHHVPYTSVETTGTGDSFNSESEYTVPYGSMSYLVQSDYVVPHGCDTDSDGMPDGWELYLYIDYINGGSGLDPWTYAERDSAFDYDGDLLTNGEEFKSVDAYDYYGSICTNGAFNYAGNWYNKWWPTDPFNDDTDRDHILDGLEGYGDEPSFMYQTWRHDPAGGSIVDQLRERFPATMRRGHVPGGGLNPCSVDTDMDYIPDHFEYQYYGYNRDTDWEGGFVNTPGDESSFGTSDPHFAGGGMDGTYFDACDWYDEFEGITETTTSRVYVMNGTEVWRRFDFDGDGLQNYQEYLVNGLYHLQYEKWAKKFYQDNGGAIGDYGSYDIHDIFNGEFGRLAYVPMCLKGGTWVSMNPVFHKWDWAAYCDDWQNTPGMEAPANFMGVPIYPFYYMPSERRPDPVGEYLYASSDPRLADSDGDNMDDYWELFHGLNPILSDMVDYCNQTILYPDYSGRNDIYEIYDFTVAPWLAGMPNADPDGDDLPNWEEALSPNNPAPRNHNTDPSPLWMTDISYAQSFVNLYYNWGSQDNYWCPNDETSQIYTIYPVPGMMQGDMRPNYIYSFECNEGFDTDNDNLSDAYELHGASGGVTEAQNTDRPLGRKALYLDGKGAVRTRSLVAFGMNALRSWTIEAWVKPENPASGSMQVIMERPVSWDDGSNAPTYEDIRRTFRLGLTATGVPFVEFDNGGKNIITERAVAPEGSRLAAGEWRHLAATMDGFQGKLALYIDGRRVASKATTAIPYTGFTYSDLNGIGGEFHRVRYSPLVIGAADANPVGKVDGSLYYNNGGTYDIIGSQPELKNYFKGWIDEVHVWNGPRPGGDDANGDLRVTKWRWPTIKDDIDNFKRYGIQESIESRNDAVKYFQRVVDTRKRNIEATTAANAGATAVGGTTWFIEGDGMTFEEFYDAATQYIQLTGGEDNEVRIPPVLLCAYNFDNLPDPEFEPVMPAKFASLNNRPLNYTGIPWLRGALDRTTVYTMAEAPYQFSHNIENMVAAFPLGRLRQYGIDEEYREISGFTGARLPIFRHRAEEVANSKYWTRDTKGGIPLTELSAYEGLEGDMFNDFPNNANPYGYRYVTANSIMTELHPLTQAMEAFDQVYSVLYNDLIPLRSARADMSVQLWDDPEGDHVGVHGDSDGDGMPDWWETANGLNPDNADQNGNGVRDDEDDFDGDGLSNYYEHLAGTDPWDATTDGVNNDAYADPDGDGLANVIELSHGTNPGDADTDDDGVADGEEVRKGTDPLDSLAPYVARSIENDGTGWLAIPGAITRKDADGEYLDRDGERFDLANWTIEASVMLRSAPAADAIILQRLAQVGNNAYATFELGITPELYPYVRFQDVLGADYAVTNATPIRLNTSARIAARFGRGDETKPVNQLAIIVDGVIVRRIVTAALPARGQTAGDVIMAKNLDGFVDEVYVWGDALDEGALLSGAFRTLVFEKTKAVAVEWHYERRITANADGNPVTNYYMVADSYRYDGGLGDSKLVAAFAFDDGGDTAEDFAHRMGAEFANAEFAANIVGGARFSVKQVFDYSEYDSDGDGLPDIWEIRNGLDPQNDDEDGNGVIDGEDDFDGDGLSNWYEYLAGTDPLDSSDDSRARDANTDADGDGLSNIMEQSFGTDPHAADTDDDGFDDGWEARNGSSPVWSTMPRNIYYPTNPLWRARSMVLDGAAHEIPIPTTDKDRFENGEWTIEAYVFLTNDVAGSVVAYQGYTGTNAASSSWMSFYELGIGAGRVPYVMYRTGFGSNDVFSVAGQAIESGRWTHIAGVFDPDAKTLELYQDGVSMYAAISQLVPLSGMASEATPKRAIIGSDGLTSGHLDDVRVWNRTLDATELYRGAHRLVALTSHGLVADFRFDDGGDTVEDYAHSVAHKGFREARKYALSGVTTTADEAVLAYVTEFDDADEDGVADDWEDFHFPEVAFDNNWYVSLHVTNGVAGETRSYRPWQSQVYSAIDLGWRCQDRTFYSNPEGRWNMAGQRSYFFRDFVLEDGETASFHMDGTGPDNIAVYINGVRIPQDEVEEAYMVHWTVIDTDLEYDEYLFSGGTFEASLKAGRNRIAVMVRCEKSIDFSKDDPTVTTLFSGSLSNGRMMDDGWWYDNVGVGVPEDDTWLHGWMETDYAFDYWTDNETSRDSTYSLGDGLPNGYEAVLFTNPHDRDSDGNGILDKDEDPDGDGLTNMQELEYGTHPMLADTDDDGVSDGAEIRNGTDPLDPESPARARAVMFDGSDDTFVASAEKEMFKVTGTFTLSASVFPTAYPAAGVTNVIVEREVANGAYNYYLRFDDEGKVHFGFTPAQRAADVVIEACTFRALPLNAWTRIEATYDAEARLITLKANGERVSLGTTENTPLTTYGSWSRPVVIGRGFTGMMRNVSLSQPGQGEEGARYVFDYRMNDGTSYVNGVAGTCGSTGWNFWQVEDYAPVKGLYDYGTWQYRLYVRAAASLVGNAYFVDLGEDGLPVVSGGDTDSDGDGLPDAWEIMYGYNPYSSDTDGDGILDGDEDDDLDGLKNWFEYRAGTDPKNAKTDGATFDGDADTDGDNLTNIQEQLYGTDPGVVDTDDDGVSDGDEVFGERFTLPTASLSPARQGVLVLNGTEVASFTNAFELSALRLAKSWTVEAWVKPEADGAIIRRGVARGGVNYELGLTDGGKPYARIQGIYDGAPDPDLLVEAVSPFAIYSGEWTHVAAVWNDATRTLALYVDGVLAADVYKREMDLGVFAQNGLAPVTVGDDGFTGRIDELRVWDIARSGASIGATAYKTFEYATTQPVVELRFDDFGANAENFGSLQSNAENFGSLQSNVEGLRSNVKRSEIGLIGATMVVDETSPIAADEFVDSDADHIPDFWEIAVFGSTMACDPNEDEDEDGLSNLYEYYSSTYPLTAYTGNSTYGTGTATHNSSTSNSSTVRDADRDADSDGLSNVTEQNLGTRPDLPDTDFDGWDDYAEINGVTTGGGKVGVSDPLNPLSPAIPRVAKFDGDGAIVVPERSGKALRDWTVAAWVKPANEGGQVVARTYRDGSVNYEIGVTNVNGALTPYAKYTTIRPQDLGPQGLQTSRLADVVVGAEVAETTIRDGNEDWLTLASNRWVHIAASYSSTNAVGAVTNGILKLYVDGTAVAWRQDALTVPFMGSGQGLPLAGETVIGDGFAGLVDDVRIAAAAVSDTDIVAMMGGSPLLANGSTTISNSMSRAYASAGKMPDGYIVRFRDGVTRTDSASKVTALGGTVRRTYSIINAAHVTLPQGADADAFRTALAADASVLYVEPNMEVAIDKSPDDADYSKLWGMNNNGQTGGTPGCDIKAEAAWDYLTGSSEIVIAVIDTGVDYKHPDLADNMWQNPGEIPDNGIDDDNNGFVDDVYGWNFVTGAPNGDPMDDHSHGTHCAGTIAGVGNNGQGVAGVNWKAKIMALKFLSASGGGSTADAIGCVDYAVQMGAKLTSNSWGGGGYSQALYDAIQKAGEAGMVFVAAAGNDGTDNDRDPHYPSSYDLDCIIAVAATDHNDDIASFSCYGATSVDIGAPGVGIYSTVPTAFGSYDTFDGTSMATPHVSGAVGLMLAADPTLTPDRIKALLMEYADPVDSLAGKCVSGARLNIGAIIPVIYNPGGEEPIIPGTRALAAHYRFDGCGMDLVHDFAVLCNGPHAWSIPKRAGYIAGTAMVATDADEDLFLGRLFGDADEDGLPDWWETMVGFSPVDAMADGRNGDADEDGLLNLDEYLASLARFRLGLRGLDPLVADTDNDGTSDYDEDSDLDGLTNGEEQDIYKTNPGDADTDDDGNEDGEELEAGLDPTDSLKPYVAQALDFEGLEDEDANTVVVKDKIDGFFTERFSSDEWTVETWVNPVAESLDGEYPLVTRRLFATGAANFELGITNGCPYARYADHTGAHEVYVAAGAAIPATNWTHVAARLEKTDDEAMNILSIIVDGERVVETRSGVVPATGPGDLVFGSAGFKGQMFDMRVWKTAQDDATIKGMMRNELIGGNVEDLSGILTVSGNGHLKETAVTVKSNGDPIDNFTGQWTLECWVKTEATDGVLIARRSQSGETEDRFNYCIELNAKGGVTARFAQWYYYWTVIDRVVSLVYGEDYHANDLVGELRVNDGLWHHVAYVRTAKQCILYVDGKLDASQSNLVRPDDNHEIDTFGILAEPGPVVIGERLAGSLDEVRIWNRDLTSAEIEDYRMRNLSGSEDGLVSYFNFDFQQKDDRADERSYMRDPVHEYGLYIGDAVRNVSDVGPSIVVSPLRSIQGLSLAGSFIARDGGTLLEDRTRPIGDSPFVNWKYAGLRASGAAALFAEQDPVSWVAYADSDGDGMPDIWEIANGFAPYNSDEDGNGVMDGYDDSDNDGLRNEAEMRAGLNPHNPDTDGNGALDYYDVAALYTNASNAEIEFSYGFLFTDNDYVLDGYENAWSDIFASPFRYDEHEDRDLDGWSNWSEAQVGTVLAYNAYNEAGEADVYEAYSYSSGYTYLGIDGVYNDTTSVLRTNSTSVAESSIEDKASNFPLPDLKVTLDYGGSLAGGHSIGGATMSTDPSGNGGPGTAGVISGAKLVIHAYSDADMNGWPDAVFVKDFSEDTLEIWPMTVTVGRDELVYGHLREGRNWFFAWMDSTEGSAGLAINGNNWPTWNDPEPAAIADNQLDGIEIGYDLNEVTFHLTDKAESFARVSWEDVGAEYTDGVLFRLVSQQNSMTAFAKVFHWPRTWMHEWDVIEWNRHNYPAAVGNFGLGANDASLKAQNTVVRFESGLVRMMEFNAAPGTAIPPYTMVVTNMMHTAPYLDAPVLHSPVNGEIIAYSTVEFRFSLDPEYTEFDFTLTRTNDNATIYSERVLAPGRYRNDADGGHDLVIWRFPYCVGDKVDSTGKVFEAGKDYVWRVVAYAPGHTAGGAVISNDSASGYFVTADVSGSGTDVTYTSGGRGSIDVKVSYPSGTAFKGGGEPFVRVQAFRSKSFNGLPDASVATNLASDVISLCGLENGTRYYVRAYIEQDGDAERDAWESWGYYRAGNASANPFVPLSVEATVAGNAGAPYEIRIQDCDTDNDLLPDAYEWAMTYDDETGTGDFSFGVSGIAPFVREEMGWRSGGAPRLFSLATILTDRDGDGVPDIDEKRIGTDPDNAYSDGDGISDGLKRALGFESGTQQSLKVTSISFANGEPVVEWGWDGVENLRRTRSATLATTVTYVVEAKKALTDDEWTTVRTVTTNALDGSTTDETAVTPEGVDISAFRFFRVRVTK